MRTTHLVLALAAAAAGCDHAARTTTPAPQPDFTSRTPHAMAARVPASPGDHRIDPAGWVFFTIDSSALTSEAQQDLDAVAQWAVAHPEQQIVIEGHADATGTADHDLELSFQRGIAVSEYLSAHGVARARITIDPEGKAGAPPGASVPDRRAIVYATRR